MQVKHLFLKKLHLTELLHARNNLNYLQAGFYNQKTKELLIEIEYWIKIKQSIKIHWQKEGF